MADTSLERYALPAEVDTSFPAMRERLIQLQPSLTSLMRNALELFDGVYPQAPHPSVDTQLRMRRGL